MSLKMPIVVPKYLVQCLLKFLLNLKANELWFKRLVWLWKALSKGCKMAT
jgi:hypothetical protein